MALCFRDEMSTYIIFLTNGGKNILNHMKCEQYVYKANYLYIYYIIIFLTAHNIYAYLYMFILYVYNISKGWRQGVLSFEDISRFILYKRKILYIIFISIFLFAVWPTTKHRMYCSRRCMGHKLKRIYSVVNVFWFLLSLYWIKKS